MKFKTILLFAALSLMLASCEDNFVTTEKESTISEPIELDSLETESILVSGRVINSSGVAIDMAELVVFQGDQEITIITNTEGEYQLELPSDSERALIQAEAEDFLTSGISTINLEAKNVTKNITLLNQSEVLYSGEVLSLTGSSLAAITGQILLADGSPAAFVNVLLLDFENIFQNKFDFTYAKTDADGHYCIAHEPFENFSLIVHDDCVNNFDFIEEQISLDTIDIELGVYESSLVEQDRYTFSGFITDCSTNQGLANGRFSIFYDSNNGRQSMTTDILNGEYNLEFTNCDNLNCVDVSILSNGADQGFATLDCIPLSDSSINVDYELCGDERDLNGEIRMLIGTDSLIYFNAQASNTLNPGGEWIILSFDFAALNGVVINSTGTDIGTHSVEFFQLLDDGRPLYTSEGPSSAPMEFIIDRLDDYIAGSFSGFVNDANGNEVNISGTYNIEL